MLVEEENEFAHHGPTDLLDKLDDSMDLQMQRTRFGTTIHHFLGS